MNEQQKVKEAFSTLLNQIDDMCQREGSDIVQRNKWNDQIKVDDSLVVFNATISTTVNSLNALKSPYPIVSIARITTQKRHNKEHSVSIERNNELGIDFKQMEEAVVSVLMKYQSPKFTKAMENKYGTNRL